MSGKVIVIGASDNPSRYSYKAVNKLLNYGYDVIPIGCRKGKIGEVQIIQKKQYEGNVYCVVLYVNAQIQKSYYDYILELKPQCVYFNPGTYNQEFLRLLEEANIKPVEGCALVALSQGNF